MTKRNGDEDVKCCVTVLARNPILGKTKTRLAAHVGQVKALKIYESLLTTCQRVTEEASFHRMVYYSEHIDPYDGWQGNTTRRLQIADGDLGERIYTAAKESLAEFHHVLIIGTDCPSLLPSQIRYANELLLELDIVIGPAMDGGFYLLGIKEIDRQWFRSIAWGSESVFDQLKRNVELANKKIGLLPLLNDIDTAADWERFKDEKQRGF